MRVIYKILKKILKKGKALFFWKHCIVFKLWTTTFIALLLGSKDRKNEKRERKVWYKWEKNKEIGSWLVQKFRKTMLDGPDSKAGWQAQVYQLNPILAFMSIWYE